jgi:DNA-binding response OmpR family regulator
LLSNAIKYTNSDGEVKFLVRSQADALQLIVSDTGVGIHPDDLPHIFDRYYQTGQADAAALGGTGIGLALTKQLVDLFDGRIEVSSILGQGSTFKVKLPRIVVDESTRPKIIGSLITQSGDDESNRIQQANASDQKPASDPSKPHLLVVEDNKEMQAYLQDVLASRYSIDFADNGKIAWEERIPEKRFDLVISDIMMPIMDGYELLNRVKNHDDYRSLPIIMLTARTDMKDRLRALRIGVDDYLTKPFDSAELIARIDNLLNYHKARLQGADGYRAKVDHPVFSAEDSKWLADLEEFLHRHLADTQYTIAQLALELAISERQLRRRIKKLTGLTPVQYFKEIRLVKSREYLEVKKFNTVAQTAGAVGFQDSGAFSRNFQKRFGKLPSDYL